MLSADAYEKSYGDEKYREAKDYTDLITALAGDLEDVEATYERKKYGKRKRKFEKSDHRESEFHQSALPLEYQLDTAINSVKTFIPSPQEEVFIGRVYKKCYKLGWNYTPANRLELKIRNVRRIILWFKGRYSMELRKRYWYEDGAIYIGDGKYVGLPDDTFTSAIAKILFRNPSVEWRIPDLIDEIAMEKGIALHSPEFDVVEYGLVKRCCQTINDKVSTTKGQKVRLVDCKVSRVKLNTKLFHILDRITTE